MRPLVRPCAAGRRTGAGWFRERVKPEVSCGLLLALDALGRVCDLAGKPRTMRVEYRCAKWIAERLQMGTSKSLKPMLLRWIQACGKSANQSQPTKAPCQQLQFQPPV